MANIYVGKGTSTEDIYCGGADADGGTAGGASATDASRVSQRPDLRMLLHVNLDSLATRREDLSRRFSVILWILHHVSTASFLHPDPPLSPLGSDLHKSFLESILVSSAIVPSYNMDLTTTSKPTFYHGLH